MLSAVMMNFVFGVASVALVAVSCIDAFQAPLPLLAKPFSVALGPLAAPSSSLLAAGALSSLLEANNDVTAVTATEIYQQHNNCYNYFWIAEEGGGVFDTVRNIAAGVTAILFLLAGLTYAYASFIIPAAAQELEKECKELDPQLWKEYAAKLGEGETMASRPDLMQELGTKLQPLVEAKLRDLDAKGLPTPLETTMNPFSGGGGQSDSDASPTMPSSSSQWDSNDDVIDVVVEKKVEDGSKK